MPVVGGHNRVYLRDAVPCEPELGIAYSKSAFGGDERFLKTEGWRNSEGSR